MANIVHEPLPVESPLQFTHLLDNYFITGLYNEFFNVMRLRLPSNDWNRCAETNFACIKRRRHARSCLCVNTSRRVNVSLQQQHHHHYIHSGGAKFLRTEAKMFQRREDQTKQDETRKEDVLSCPCRWREQSITQLTELWNGKIVTSRHGTFSTKLRIPL